MDCEMDIKYENYLKSDDKTKIINGKEYEVGAVYVRSDVNLEDII